MVRTDGIDSDDFLLGEMGVHSAMVRFVDQLVLFSTPYFSIGLSKKEDPMRAFLLKIKNLGFLFSAILQKYDLLS